MRFQSSGRLLPVARLLLAAAIVAIGITGVVGYAVQPAAAAPEPVVVGATSHASMKSVRARIEAMGGKVEKQYLWGGYLVTPPASADRGRFKASAKGIPGVKYAIDQGVVHAAAAPAPWTTPRTSRLAGLSAALTPNDPAFPSQWGLTRIGAPAAWDTAVGTGMAIAIVDSGVDYTHPDLLDAVYLGPDFVDNDTDPMDEFVHGTMMAGIAAAWTNNGMYGAGTAPGAWLVAVRVLDENGSGFAADVADGIVWSADAGVDIINLSLAGSDESAMQPLIDAVAYARTRGCLVIAASGNVQPGRDAGTRTYPATCDGVVGVGATASSTAETVWSGTIHGTRPDGTPVVTVVAPGQFIYVIQPGPGHTAVTGTSCASAKVSGAAAVIWSAHPGYTADEIASVLASSALDIAAPGRDIESGWGRIRLDAAVLWPAPAVPDGLTAAWQPPGLQAGLTWRDNSTTETGFVLERAQNTTDPGAFSHVATLAADATSYTDAAGLDWGSTWYYRVSAFNLLGSSPWTDVASAKLDSQAPTSTLLVDGVAPTGGWFTATPTVSLSANDSQSGVAELWIDRGSGAEIYPGPFSVGEGRTPVRYWAVDAADNAEAPRTETVSVDLTKPTASSDATTALYFGTARIRVSGEDALSGVAQYAYRIDGGADVTGATASVGTGSHTFEGRVRDSAGLWSDYTTPVTVTVLPTIPVYRFYNRQTGTHFYTADVGERDSVIANLAWLYAFEGPAYSACEGSLGGAVPLFRFYNRRTGTHFYTADEGERDSVIANLAWLYAYEGPAYHVLPVPSPSVSAAHRFYNWRTGTHFYTADEVEKSSVIANLGWLYAYEGPGFFVAR